MPKNLYRKFKFIIVREIFFRYKSWGFLLFSFFLSFQQLPPLRQGYFKPIYLKNSSEHSGFTILYYSGFTIGTLWFYSGTSHHEILANFSINFQFFPKVWIELYVWCSLIIILALRTFVFSNPGDSESFLSAKLAWNKNNFKKRFCSLLKLNSVAGRFDNIKQQFIWSFLKRSETDS